MRLVRYGRCRYAVDINGMNGVIITKLDVLDDLPAVQVAVAYDLDGQEITTYPVLSEAIPRCRPVFQEFAGWEKPTTRMPAS